MGHGPQFMLTVVEPRDDQRRDLLPGSRVMDRSYGIEHRLETSAAYTSVEVIGKRLQVDIVGIDQRQRFIQKFTGVEAIGHEHRAQASLSCLYGYIQGILRPHCGLIVCTGCLLYTSPS